jgi:glycosyltransferase involved in cell wall biosynthesis
VIGVVVPANDEEALIGRCLDALRVAAAHPALDGEEVRIVVVLDACRDGTQRIVEARGETSIVIDARNVGIARATGASALIARGARWLAFTDADSAVAPDWLARQLDAAADAVCGVVCIDDWGDYSPEARASYEAAYVDAEHHRHVHGASLGVSSAAYIRVGGFSPLRCSEDVELVHRLDHHGATIRWTNAVRVNTSARRLARAPGGFAAHLQSVEHRVRMRRTTTAPLVGAVSSTGMTAEFARPTSSGD